MSSERRTSLFSQRPIIKEALREAAQYEDYDRHFKNEWDPSGGFYYRWYSYENTFNVFGRFLVPTTLKERKLAGKESYGLDLAGLNGRALRELAREDLLNGGLTVSLLDVRTPSQKQIDADVGADVMAGNLLRGKTWRSINNWIEEHSKEGKFNVIVSRPKAGFPEVYPYDAYRVLLQRIWNMLSYDEGCALLEIPKDNLWYLSNDINMESFFKALNSYDGITSRFVPDNESLLNRGVAMLKKSPGAPDVLPYNI